MGEHLNLDGGTLNLDGGTLTLDGGTRSPYNLSTSGTNHPEPPNGPPKINFFFTA